MTDKQKNYIRAKAIEQKNKERILAVCSEATDDSRNILVCSIRKRF